jgi:hypothetical protein
MPGTGLEPVRGKPPQDFKSCVSANSTTPAHRKISYLAALLRQLPLEIVATVPATVPVNRLAAHTPGRLQVLPYNCQHARDGIRWEVDQPFISVVLHDGDAVTGTYGFPPGWDTVQPLLD